MIKAQNIIFDIDGTLVNTSLVSIPAFEMVLKRLQNDGFNIGNHTKEEIMKYIGFTIDEIWKNLFKNDDPVLIEKAIRYLDHYEELVLQQAEDIFFEGVVPVLRTLKEKGKKLYLLSNCNIKYMESVLSKGIRQFIDFPNCSEMYGWKQKDEVIRIMMEKYNSKDFVMIGDREKDISAAHANHIPAIGCNYGYGGKEVKDADIIVNSFYDILEYIE